MPIWRPGGIAVIPIAVGKLLGFAACDIDEEEVLTTLMDKTHAVEPVPESIYDPRFGQRFAIFGFLVCRANRCIEYQPLAIRRPGRVRGAMLHKGELASFATIGWN